jgi:hypothetical protein
VIVPRDETATASLDVCECAKAVVLDLLCGVDDYVALAGGTRDKEGSPITSAT